MDTRSRTVVGRSIEFVGRAEYRRLLVVVGVPVLFVALVWQGNNLGLAALLLAAGLAAFLYTRPTAQKTVAASLYATGALLIGLFVLALYWNWSTASTEPLVGTATRYLWQLVTGTLLAGLGLWLRQTEF